MPFNKYLIEEKSTLLQNKLEKLATNLSSGGSFQTEEEIITEVIRVLDGFYKDLNEPMFQPEIVMEGDIPDPDLYNRIWNTILDDLSIVFSELENLEGLTLNNFNFITTESSRLLARLKNVSSQLGDYILYSANPTRDAFYFKDSFNDLSRIDTNSSLLNKPQCEIDQDQGIVLLPINKEKESVIKITAQPVINNNSNGFVGNNQQINAAYNGDPKAILDNNPDTWFEYERVVSKLSTEEPLVLDMTINLGTEQIVNYIRVNPNNFGTKTTILIDRIETSLDGKVYTNVKDDIPIGDFLTKDEDNVFVLSPSTSKFAGQGIFSFTPRKAKYVHFVFKQSEPYIIKTPTGDKLRYAIGLRDIDIRGFQYLPEGEIISEAYSFVDNNEIRKVAMDANQNPLEESSLASIKYFLSPDNGQTWNEVRPKSFEGFANEESAAREIVDYNGSDENTINTSVPVTSIRLKAVLKREDAAFTNGESTFRKEIKSRSEIHKVPQDSPFLLTLEQPPVNGTLEIIDPQYGSRGRPEYQYIIGGATNTSGNVITYYLPFSSYKPVYKKVLVGSAYTLQLAPASEWMHISVGGEEWTMATQDLEEYTGNYSTAAAYRLYRFNPNRGTLRFGNGANTMSPPTGKPISMYLDAERLYPSETPDAHVAPLEFKTSNDKDQFTLERYEEEMDATMIVPKKASIIRLDHENITDLGTIASTLYTMGFTVQVTYLNGRDELVSNNRWSIDTEDGVIYLGAETSASSNNTISYSYQTITTLTKDDWDWESGASLRDSIKIKESAWKTIHQDDLTLPSTEGIKVIDLAHFAVVKGTLELAFQSDEPGTATHPLLKEVPYVNGASEFGFSVKQVRERVKLLVPNEADDIAVFDLNLPITSDTAFKVTFSKPGFFSSANDDLAQVGDYRIDRNPASPTYRRVFVRLPENETVSFGTAGYVTYYYTTPNYSTTGLYSVDYKLGRVYMQRAMPAGAGTLVANYQYTDYRAEYNIARVVPAGSYEINRTDRTVRIKDSEALNRAGIPRERLGEQLPYYQITYDYVSVTRENIEDLKDYFSPVLKDYVLKVITKDKLI
jgi:hypothetical protein